MRAFHAHVFATIAISAFSSIFPASAAPGAIRFENAKPRSGAVQRIPSLQAMTDQMRRARRIAPLGNSQKAALLGGGFTKLDSQPMIYATVGVDHLYDAGHAELLLMAPLMVLHDGDQGGALFAPSTAKVLVFASSLKLTVTPPGPGLYLADLVISPTGILAPPPDTVNFSIASDSQQVQTISLAGGGGPQHLVFALHATAAGSYAYTIGTTDAAWIFTTCTVTRMQNQ